MRNWSIYAGRMFGVEVRVHVTFFFLLMFFPWNDLSPWYPNTKLYRQKTANEWDEVVARIADDLAA